MCMARKQPKAPIQTPSYSPEQIDQNMDFKKEEVSEEEEQSPVTERSVVPRIATRQNKAMRM